MRVSRRVLVHTVMSSPVVSIGSGATVREAAREMRNHRVGSIVVVDGSNPTGIITESDMVDRVIAASADPDATRTREVMSAPLVTVLPTAHIEEAAERMRDRYLKRLVVALDGEVRGVITVRDIAYAQPELGRRFHEMLRTGWDD